MKNLKFRLFRSQIYDMILKYPPPSNSLQWGTSFQSFIYVVVADWSYINLWLDINDQLFDCWNYTTKLTNNILKSHNIGNKIHYFKYKSMLDDLNYYIRRKLKGKNSILLRTLKIESSNLGIMLDFEVGHVNPYW